MELSLETEKYYQEAIDYLVNLTKFGINLGLGRIQSLLKALGNPEKNLKVIHIGGTNGKGSTAVMTREILQEAGYKVGMFTSPHLHDYRERITVNGQMISKGKTAELIFRLHPVLEKLVAEGVEHPTEFEVSTAIALLYFAEENVDFAVIEVGLGGEIDSTNVVSPLVAVVTNVGMDHMDYLGNTLEEIARVKAGIFKPGTVGITAAERPEVLKVLREKGKEAHIRLIEIGRDVRGEQVRISETEQEIDLFGLNGDYPGIVMSLTGLHQMKNAAVALTVCEVLAQEYKTVIPRQAIYSGFKKARWPGRLELISDKPKVLLDGAHNLDGAKMLADALTCYSRRRLILCLGMLADKEREKVVATLAPLADEIIVTKPNSPRAGNWEALADLARHYAAKVTLIADPKEAVLYALGILGEEDMLCVTGSLYMIADARQALIEKLGSLK